MTGNSAWEDGVIKVWQYMCAPVLIFHGYLGIRVKWGGLAGSFGCLWGLRSKTHDPKRSFLGGFRVKNALKQ